MRLFKFSINPTMWLLTLLVLGSLSLMAASFIAMNTSPSNSTASLSDSDKPIGWPEEPRTPMLPQGTEAIKPTIANAPPNTPAFTRADVENYIARAFDAGLGPGVTLHGPITIKSIEFLTERELKARHHGASTGYPDDTLLCYVELGGSFNAPGSPHGGELTGCNRALEVFHAHTGNQLMWAIDCNK